MSGSIPVPGIVARRAWECALDMLDQPIGPAAAFIRCAAAFGPERLTWTECGALFRLHRLHYVERAA